VCAAPRCGQRPLSIQNAFSTAQLQKSERLGKFAAPQRQLVQIGKHDLLAVDRPLRPAWRRAGAPGPPQVVRDSRLDDRRPYHDGLAPRARALGGIPELKPPSAAESREVVLITSYPDYNHLLANGLPLGKPEFDFSPSRRSIERGSPRTFPSRDKSKLSESAAVW